MTSLFRLKLGGKKGFTLVEVLVSAGLLSIALSGIVGVMVKGRLASHNAGNVYTAYNLAKSRIESLRAMSFSDLTYANETDTILNGEGVPDPEGIFKRSTVVTTSFSGSAALAKIVVTTTYTYQGKTPASPIELTTVVYNG